MPYRSTKEKAEAQKVARKLYTIDGLSLKEIHQQTGETMRTLKAWRTLGDWENLREAETKTELDRWQFVYLHGTAPSSMAIHAPMSSASRSG